MAPPTGHAQATKARAQDAGTASAPRRRARSSGVKKPSKRVQNLVQVSKGKRGIGKEHDDGGDSPRDDTSGDGGRESVNERRQRSVKSPATISSGPVTDVLEQDGRSTPAAADGQLTEHVPPYAFIDIDRLLDGEDVASIAQAAFNSTHASLYPPLPMIGNQALPESVDPTLFDMDQPGPEQGQYQPAAHVPQPASTVDTDTTLSASDSNNNGVIRPIPHVPHAAQRLQSDGHAYTNRARDLEGTFRGLLHHLTVIKTRKNSYRARQLLAGRETEVWESLRDELRAKLSELPVVGPSSLVTFDAAVEDVSTGSPFVDRLYGLLYATLMVQAYDALPGVVFRGAGEVNDDCALAAREWTVEKLTQLAAGVRGEIGQCEHLRTTRQAHMVMPSD